jgi:8-oxo-dGTP diphosphatase
MPTVELTTMVRIENPRTGEVLVQDRIRSFKGLAFPGGHVELGESFYDCAVREIKQETGLTIQNLQGCGVCHWHNTVTGKRYLVFLYTTCDYAGELTAEMEEGRHFWMQPEDLAEQAKRSENSFAQYLPMFAGQGYSEGYGAWRSTGDEDCFLYR